MWMWGKCRFRIIFVIMVSSMTFFEGYKLPWIYLWKNLRFMVSVDF